MARVEYSHKGNAVSVDNVLSARAALGVASRRTTSGSPDPARVITARRELNAALVERSIERAITADGSLTTDQRQRLAALLTGAAR